MTRVDAEGYRSAIERKRLSWLPGDEVRYVVVDPSGERRITRVEEPPPEEGERAWERWISARVHAEE